MQTPVQRNTTTLPTKAQMASTINNVWPGLRDELRKVTSSRLRSIAIISTSLVSWKVV
tara:strand:- start:1386 stop:1559 length:174 start_codon:yes stop_codon:yes gene_type:complete